MKTRLVLVGYFVEVARRGHHLDNFVDFTVCILFLVFFINYRRNSPNIV
jgi:hypothetical protein